MDINKYKLFQKIRLKDPESFGISHHTNKELAEIVNIYDDSFLIKFENSGMYYFVEKDGVRPATKLDIKLYENTSYR